MAQQASLVTLNVMGAKEVDTATARLSSLLRSLEANLPTIICLQEINRKSISALQAWADRHRYTSSTASETQARRAILCATLALAKEEAAFTTTDLPRHTDGKDYQVVQATLESLGLAVHNVHFHHRHAPTRRLQMASVASELPAPAVGCGGKDTIVCGDFNVDLNNKADGDAVEGAEPVLPGLLAGFDDCVDAAATTPITTHHAHGTRPDGVFHRGSAWDVRGAARLPSAAALSDHDGLVVALRRARPAPRAPRCGPRALEDMAAAGRVLLASLGEDPERDGIKRTPLRMAKSLRDLTRGYDQNLEEIVGEGVFSEGHAGAVVVRNIDLFSLCEHHMLPFFGKAHVGYVPNEDGRVLGLSKLARITDMFAKRLQVQERLTTEIAAAVEAAIGARGVGVVVEATHLCMVMRGVQKIGSSTVTSAFTGVFETDDRTRSEFLQCCCGGGGGATHSCL